MDIVFYILLLYILHLLPDIYANFASRYCIVLVMYIVIISPAHLFCVNFLMQMNLDVAF